MPPVHADPVHSMYITWPYLVLADNYQAESLIPEITVILLTQYMQLTQKLINWVRLASSQ